MTKYLIIENEYFAARNLIRIISNLRPDYKPAFCLESVEDAVDLLRTDPDIDLIFMDVELVDGNCFDIVSQVEIKVPVIFTTAYSDFALKAFILYSVDYLLKPLTEEAVEKAIQKFERFQAGSAAIVPQPIQQPSSHKSRILISEGDNYSYISTEDLAMIQSEDKYVFLHMFSGKRHITDYANLNAVEEDLDKNQFFRISRNMIVNIRLITSVRKHFKGRLKVTINYNGKHSDIVISSARKDTFLQWLGGHKAD